MQAHAGHLHCGGAYPTPSCAVRALSCATVLSATVVKCARALHALQQQALL